ncbi:hypothetical protein, partial [Trinickia diaoshuihuensis]|uniref:hypothetical protein n=1 Tax=Trinickia diaoshuihuensis TaxID=2292265 RepID=UPI0019677F8E
STIRFSAETSTAFNFPPQLPRTPHSTLAHREAAIDDYIRAFMPELSKDQLATARDRVRNECRRLGIVVGDDV